MPTQEEINAAQVELQIANDNYADLAKRYNQYKQLFQDYANSSPETQDKASEAMGWALEDFYQTQEKMYAAEDRINVAQNRVNAINDRIAAQETLAAQQAGQRRRTIIPSPNPNPNPNPNPDYNPDDDLTLRELTERELNKQGTSLEELFAPITINQNEEPITNEQPPFTGRQTLVTPEGIVTIENGVVTNVSQGPLNTFGNVNFGGNNSNINTGGNNSNINTGGNNTIVPQRTRGNGVSALTGGRINNGWNRGWGNSNGFRAPRGTIYDNPLYGTWGSGTIA